eukprot:GEMP01045206.1.p1 GENE.GEMP01045206.1~~GEMP01045206.1.p1  ORF type:complete len:366 (+),score=104.37 GEMP01045206.1:79-1176(+)
MDRSAIAAALAKVEAAKQNSDLEALKKALQEARDAGAPAGFIDQAFQEIGDIEASAQGAPAAKTATATGSSTGKFQLRTSGNGGAPANATATTSAAGGTDGDANATVDAAASTASAMAFRWKDRGNAKLKEGHDKAILTEALACYSSGLGVDGLKNATLLAQLYGNRAHVHTLLRNFVEAVDDCRKSLDIDPSNAKVYWRGARASMLNELYQQGVDFCDRGLAVYPTNDDLIKMKEQCSTKLNKRNASKRMANPEEVMEMRDRVDQLHEQIVSCTMQLQGKDYRKRQSEYTLMEMDALPEDTRTFLSCGKAFLLTPQSTVKEKLASEISSLNDELPKLTETREGLNNRLEAAEKEFMEIRQAACK